MTALSSLEPVEYRRSVARRWVPLWLMRLVIDWRPPFDRLFWKTHTPRREGE